MNPYPIRFRPLFKQTIWGGRRLADQLGKTIGPEADYAESWEVVDHGTDQSLVENGPLAGTSLADLISRHARWLLGDGAPGRSFPLLLKYLDCNRVLSVQVHPDDQYGATMTPPDLGKTEAWYIVAAEPGSLIYAGLKSGVDREDLRSATLAGQTESVLHSFEPDAGDVVFIPAGTVHALGAGLLVAEIQQSSDTTFRLFDWNRVDGQGKARPLHLDQALEVSDYQSGPVVARQSDPETAGWQTLVQCDKFVLSAMEKGSALIAGDGQFHIITVPRGSASLRTNEETQSLTVGASILLPAASEACEIELHGDATVLAMRLPEA